MKPWRLLGLLVLNAAAIPAGAGSFAIAPIRVELGAAHRSAALTLTNADDQPVVIQIRTRVWSQQDGIERLDETHDVLASPAVLQIPGKGSQVVRIALRAAPDADRELTYRVLFDEVPQAATPGFTGLRVALRLSVPVFVASAHGRTRADVRWQVRRLSVEEFEVDALNEGTAHLQIAQFDVQVGAATPLHAKTPHYVLPGDRVAWRLKADSAVPPDSAMIIHGRSDMGDFSAVVTASGP